MSRARKAAIDPAVPWIPNRPRALLESEPTPCPSSWPRSNRGGPDGVRTRRSPHVPARHRRLRARDQGRRASSARPEDADPQEPEGLHAPSRAPRAGAQTLSDSAVAGAQPDGEALPGRTSPRLRRRLGGPLERLLEGHDASVTRDDLPGDAELVLQPAALFRRGMGGGPA